MKWLALVLFVGIAFVIGVKYSEGGGKLADIQKKVEGTFQSGDGGISSGKEASLCKYASSTKKKNFTSNGDLSAFQVCQKELKEANKAVQNSYFCFPESTCPSSEIK